MNRTFPLIVAVLFAALILPVHANSNRGTRSEIVAGQNNSVKKRAANSVIAGGSRNSVGSKGKQAIVVGGQNNLANGTAAFAAGNRAQAKHNGTFVWADGQGATFGSTGNNQFLIRAAGGVGINTNNPQGNALSVRGNTLLTGNLQVTGNINGQFNTGTFTDLTVTGRLLSGSGNALSGAFSTVSGGANNTSSSDYATVGGGQQNKAEGESDTVAGGQGNTAGGDWAFIGGGRQNTNGGFAATIAGGELNRAGDAHAAVGGGLSNIIAAGATAAVISGGAGNTAEVAYSAIGGGAGNIIKFVSGSPKFAVIGGGGTNLITNSSYASTIGGGVNNKATNEYATIAGGDGNTAGLRAAVGGGSGNTASGFAAAIVGGQNNTASGLRSLVGGGINNGASEQYAVVGGGQNNTASGVGSTVSGGAENTANTNYSAVPGGLNNTASGEYSFAAGRRAKAKHAGSFVWADSTDADFSSGASNQFLVRSSFVGINCTNPITGADVFAVKSSVTGWFGGMYVSTSGSSGLPFYGYSLDGTYSDAYSYVDGADAKKWKLYVGSGDRITVNATNGNVGIGTTAPTNKLSVNGTVQIVSIQVMTGSGAPPVALAAPNGSIYLRTDGAAGTTLYVRAAGAWTPLAPAP